MTDFADDIPPALKPIGSPIVLPSPAKIDSRNRIAKASMYEYYENPPPLLKIEDSTELLPSKNIWRPLAIDVGSANGQFSNDSRSITRKNDSDQFNSTSLVLQDQLKCEEKILQESKLASNHMHYAGVGHVTAADHDDRSKTVDSATPSLRNVADYYDREEMDSGLDSPNDPDAFEKNGSNADQHDHTTASSSPDNFCSETAQSATTTKKKPRKRRWILSRKPKVHRSSTTKILKTGSKEKIPNIQESKHDRNGSKYLSVSANLESMIHSSVFCPPVNNKNKNLEIFNINDEPSSIIEERNVVFSEKFFEFLCKFLPNLDRIDDENTPRLNDHRYSIKNWSVDQVAEFIRKLKLSSTTTTAAKSPSSCKMTAKQPFQWLQPTADDHLAEKFRDEQIDGEALLLLSREDLVRRLNIKLGLAMKIYYTIKCLNYKLCSIRN